MDKKYSGFVANILDIEASGFGPNSYPVEIGLVLASGDQYQSLIAPAQSWTHWDREAENIHGIKRADLACYGKSIEQVCLELNEICGGQTLHSDCWVLDLRWIIKLFAQANISPAFTLSPIEALLTEDKFEKFYTYKQIAQQSLHIKVHRALNDARIIQTALQLITAKQIGEPYKPWPQIHRKMPKYLAHADEFRSHT